MQCVYSSFVSSCRTLIAHCIGVDLDFATAGGELPPPSCSGSWEASQVSRVSKHAAAWTVAAAAAATFPSVRQRLLPASQPASDPGPAVTAATGAAPAAAPAAAETASAGGTVS
jgi:hypothetical protein